MVVIEVWACEIPVVSVSYYYWEQLLFAWRVMRSFGRHNAVVFMDPKAMMKVIHQRRLETMDDSYHLTERLVFNTVCPVPVPCSSRYSKIHVLLSLIRRTKNKGSYFL
jgi:hypothetical protein